MKEHDLLPKNADAMLPTLHLRTWRLQDWDAGYRTWQAIKKLKLGEILKLSGSHP